MTVLFGQLNSLLRQHNNMDMWYIIGLFTLVTEYNICQTFKETEWINLKPVKDRTFNAPMFRTTMNSELSCVIDCASRPCCIFVTYTSTSGSCRGHTVVHDTTSEFSNSTETNAYYIPGKQDLNYTYLEAGNLCLSFKWLDRSWTEAAQACRNEDTDLLIVDTMAKQTAIAAYLKADYVFDSTRFWIGGSDASREGQWVWMDGSVISMSKDFWNSGEPNNALGGEDCLVISTTNQRKWNDGECDKKKPYICGYTV